VPDLVIRSQDISEAQPGLNPLREIMLVSRSKSVDTVIVDGRIVIRHGRLALADEASVFARARVRAWLGRTNRTSVGSIWEHAARA
jgi:cytosine/adenosine deaminase-related metal-dependent hydrolase